MVQQLMATVTYDTRKSSIAPVSFPLLVISRDIAEIILHSQYYQF